MKKKQTQFYLIPAFIFAQLAWMALLGLWIYWYISNYIIFKQVGDKISPKILVDNQNVLIFTGGIILIVGIAFTMVIIFRNLTVQMKLTKLYDNFIANITHELKSPLSSIQLYLETLNSKSVPENKQKEFLSIMSKDADRLKKLINSILEISRLEQKRIAHDYHVFDSEEIFRKLIKDSAQHFRIPESALSFNGSIESKCVIDAEAMQIVFDNLMDNASKYSINPVEITVNFKEFKKKIIVEFKDYGIGILPKDQKKVFNKFQRIYNKNIPNVKGTGLGLYWVKEIIKYHGGKITLFSEGLNKGTCFSIELPIYLSSKKMYIKSLLKVSAKSKTLELTDGR